MATLPFEVGYQTNGAFLANRSAVFVGFSGSLWDVWEELTFYDVRGEATLETMPGITTADPWETTFFIVPNSKGTVLFLVGERRVFFVPIDYETSICASDPATQPPHFPTEVSVEV